MAMMPDPNVQAELQKLLLRADDFFFFETAYQWRFEKRIDVSGDVTAWRVQQIVPSYVAEFILHIRPKTVVMATDYWKQQRGDADDDSFGF